MRVVIKGGVWKNTEDEILKAAVMKYGKNQWARISSLLVRKTPKQCKARWYEWLDPSIKKTEWSKEEDEKLLHLAKLMPTQWRTIAPIVGRTSAQCLERYQKLLDEAEAKEGEGDAGPNADDVRRLRPGEIDPEPEAKPARPDPVDMDEDEKEMLSEARARLANTQGKKAKRKAREKQLEEARRLASLQKRRELKAAGIDLRKKKPKHGMDYNADIPFYTPAPAGFWDPSDEKEREAKTAPNQVDVLLSTLEGKRRADIEAEERKKDAKRQKTQKEAGTYVPPSAFKAAALAQQMSQRNKLVLPAPQMGEADLEELIKLGNEGEAVKAIIGEEGDASNTLLGDYSMIRTNQPVRTPRATATNDNIRTEARNLRALTEAQTPLLGGSIDVVSSMEGGTGFEGITPRRAVLQTPNPLSSHLTPRSGANQVGMTPRGDFHATPRSVASRVSRTPLRDEMGINTPRDDFSSGFDDTPRSMSSRGRQNFIREQLASHFAALPKPKNDFEIVLPDPRPLIEEHITANDNSRNDVDYIAMASELLKKEIAAVKEDCNIDQIFESVTSKFMYIRPVKSYMERTEVDDNLRISHYEAELDAQRLQLSRDATIAGKLEKKLALTLGGYQSRSLALEKSLQAKFEELQDARLKHNAFTKLRQLEVEAAESRVEKLKEDLTSLERQEAEGQEKYKQLMEEREALINQGL